MPLDFPASPSLNDTYSFGGRTWICAHHKALWQYHSDILLETSAWDGIMFRLKFAELFRTPVDQIF